jgi:hypothetical protein
LQVTVAAPPNTHPRATFAARRQTREQVDHLCNVMTTGQTSQVQGIICCLPRGFADGGGVFQERFASRNAFPALIDLVINDLAARPTITVRR